MALNFKNITLLSIVASGLILFFLNAYKLSLNNQTIYSIKKTETITSVKEESIIPQKEIINLSSEFSESNNK